MPATEVDRRAGYGIAVLLKIYAHCTDGQADALAAPAPGKNPGDEGDDDCQRAP